MQFNFVAFNFQGADLAAEERHYLARHVELARRMTGLRFYFTGRTMAALGRAPERVRVALQGFDDAKAAAEAAGSTVVPELVADSSAHLKDLMMKSVTGDVVIPFESRKPGQPCFIMAAEFDLAAPGGDGAAAERHYLDVHVAIARRLPGLRNYLAGKIDGAGASSGERQRMAVLVFDSRDALREAYRSPVGQELVRDEQATIRNPRVWRIDARVEL
jgi:uncharacterized protein (TIGR02118 family)